MSDLNLGLDLYHDVLEHIPAGLLGFQEKNKHYAFMHSVQHNNIVRQGCLSVEGRPPANRIHRHTFCSCDLDLDRRLLDLDTPKMYLLTRNELSGPKLSKVRALQTDRQTHRTDATENVTTPDSRRNVRLKQVPSLDSTSVVMIATTVGTGGDWSPNFFPLFSKSKKFYSK